MYDKPANNVLANHLIVLLADSFTLYLQAHGAHWNVKGPAFSAYHEFFQEIYEDIYGSIDDIAENIRKLDHDNVPFELEDFVQYRTIDSVKSSDNLTRALTQALHDNNEKYLETLDSAFQAAEQADQQGIMNFLAERIDMHQKWAWQLKSSLSH